MNKGPGKPSKLNCIPVELGDSSAISIKDSTIATLSPVIKPNLNLTAPPVEVAEAAVSCHTSPAFGLNTNNVLLRWK